MTLCLMSHRVLLNPPIILLMDPGGIPSDGVKGSPGESQTWGERGRGEEEALAFIPRKLHAWPPSLRSIGHALPPSLLLHTPNKHSSAHVQARKQNSVSPAVTGAQGLSVHLGRAHQHQGWRSMLSNL